MTQRESTISEEDEEESSVQFTSNPSEYIEMASQAMTSQVQMPSIPMVVVPEAPPQNNWFYMKPEDLQRLVTGVLTGTSSGTGSAKFSEQSKFTGKPKDLEPMIWEAEVRFSVLPNQYNNMTKKAFYILSLFDKGTAKLWKEQYLRQRESQTLCLGDSFTQFKVLLTAAFKDVTSKDEAMS